MKKEIKDTTTQLDIERKLFRNTIQAVKNQLAATPKMGPTSRKEVKIIHGMLEDVEALGLKAIDRKRIK